MQSSRWLLRIPVHTTWDVAPQPVGQEHDANGHRAKRCEHAATHWTILIDSHSERGQESGQCSQVWDDRASTLTFGRYEHSYRTSLPRPRYREQRVIHNNSLAGLYTGVFEYA